MTPFELTKKMQTLRELLGAATPGPWSQATHVGEPRAIVATARPMQSLLAVDADGMAIVDRECDAALIAEARNTLPVLLAEIERCWDKLERVRLWTFEGGKSLSPRGADTYGEGKRDAKQEVSRILSAETNR